jgi:hypothetical protein
VKNQLIIRRIQRSSGEFSEQKRALKIPGRLIKTPEDSEKPGKTS